MKYDRFVEDINTIKCLEPLYYLPQNSNNALKNWLEYKYPQLLQGKRLLGDLDVSELAIVTYILELFKFKKAELYNIHDMIDLQANGHVKYRILFEPELRGDWLTSPLHLIKLYMGLLWESDKTEKENVLLFYVKKG